MNKTITIENVYKLFKKYGDLNIKVNSPYGYKKILDCDITETDSKVVETITENGLSLKSSPKHLLKTKNGRFKPVIELRPGKYIKTKNGNEKVKSIEILSVIDDLYDIQVEDVEQYYSNGIVSHNSALMDSIA